MRNTVLHIQAKAYPATASISVKFRGKKEDIDVPDQIGTLSQVRTKKISKGGWTIQELFEPRRNHILKFSFSKSSREGSTRDWNWFSSSWHLS